ncbi:BP28CT domain-containing protein [Rutstroemia sp. NJR-2017a BVV2]|nr:BP28CT domain-containing protein [Rutstroemia sp. NJR-2017a BVV2]
MATSLQAQLSQIATNSVNSLNLKAQKAAHSKSLIFEPRIAASQSFDTLYTICHEGFQELCLLDNRFLEFQKTIFSEQSQAVDRTQLPVAEISELDKRLEAFLGLVGGRLRLNPAIKAVEWLVRRFRIHEYNTSFLLSTFLPYHTLPIFTTLLSILPSNIPVEYNFLTPYIRSLTAPQRRAFVNAATNSTVFASTLNTYVVRISKARQHYPALLAFWAGIMTEAISGMLDKARSGRKGVQLQNEQDHRAAKQITRRVTRELLKIPDLSAQLIELGKERRVDRLANGLCLALVERINKSGDAQGLPIIARILENGLLSDAQTAVVTKHLLLVAHRIDDKTDSEHNTRSHLASTLVELVQFPGHVGSVIQGALKETDVDMDELELKLRTTIRPKAIAEPTSEDVTMEDADSKPDTRPDFWQLIAQVPQRTTTETSFLAHSASHIYQDLCQAFLLATASVGDLDAFDELPILSRSSALDSSLYLTFYIKTWCGPYPVLARVSALHMVGRYLSNSEASDVDIQAIIPYAVAALADPASKVRRAAAELVLMIEKFYPTSSGASKGNKQRKQWAFNDLYGSGEETQETKWMSADIAGRLLREVLVPNLEECVLDRSRIESVFEQSMNGSRGSAETSKKSERLPQSARASVLSFMSSHVICTPLYLVKLRLLVLLNHVRSVAGTTRTKVLLPALQKWASLTEEQALEHSAQEAFEVRDFDKQAASTVVANDKEGLQYFTQIVHGEVARDRPTLLEAVFARLREMWSSLKGDIQLQIAQMLLDASQSSPDEQNYNAKSTEEALELLRNAPLSTDILLTFLNQLPTTAKLADTPPASKRRRTSHGEVARSPLQDPKQLTAAIRQVTFVLQLVDGSNPGKHPELLKPLFNTLAELQHFKTKLSSELAYLQDLVLSSLLSIMKAYKEDPTMDLDPSDVRADLLVDCVQKTASPQVQNSALLMIAALADIAPEVVLHSVMPIFTFMGSSVLRQNDDYSAHVISQTIREVIPPLISSLRQDKGNPVTGAAELLLSFVAAYEHIPVHRRKGLFVSLVQTLGAEDFLFALLIMLVDKYGVNDNIKSFAAELTNSFSVETQLQSAVKYLELINDLLKPKPTFSLILLGAHEKIDPQRAALNELLLLPHILSQRRLVSQTAKILDRDDMDAARIRELYSTLLEDLLGLAESLKEQKRMHAACGDVLESLLGLLSTREFVKSIESLLDRPNEALRRKILRSLEVRIDQESPADAVSRVAMLSFLPQLTAIIRESTDVLYKHTAVACVDKISEKYGKKDLEAVAAAAETIASDDCLGQSDPRLRVMALLCLTSLVDILKEGIVSVLPVAIPKALEYIAASLNESVEAQKIHNAGYAFISSLIQHLPYMISGSYLDTLLSISNTSAEADLEDEADESREQCLHFAAKQVDPKSMFSALERNWPRAVETGTWAIREQLEMLSISIKKHPKSVVAKHSAVLAKIFQDALDLRRQLSSTDNEDQDDTPIVEIEAQVNEVALEMIYKFNDSTFRPIFANLVEWASSSLPKKDKAGRHLRLQSLYGFLNVFFGNLKSIVTSYATYLIDNAVEVLKDTDIRDDASRSLWSRVLQALVPSFEHDQDDFWQSPSHFKAIAPVLCDQLRHGSNLPLVEELIPAIVELAAAADSSDHHKELNGMILKHLRSETAGVRLAAVKCEQALTDRLGEEWLSMLPEMLPYISELQEDDDEVVEKETHRWIVKIEGVLGEDLDSMLHQEVMFKPFRPPLLKSVPRPAPVRAEVDTSDTQVISDSEEEILTRPTKKRRLLIHEVDEAPKTKVPIASIAASAPRKPLLVVPNSAEPSKATNAPPANVAAVEKYYLVLRKFTAKKHKTWDGDGVLAVSGGYARLQNIDGRDMGRCMYNEPLEPGSTLSIGGKDIEIDAEITRVDYLAGRPFLQNGLNNSVPKTNVSPALQRAPLDISKSKAPLTNRKDSGIGAAIPAKSFYASVPKSNASKAQFKNPLLATTIMPQNKNGAPTPRHDPSAPDAIVMQRPPYLSKGKVAVDVVVDPFLSRHLRDHQKEGVKFLYECVMGYRSFNGQGAILADEMGLGKTLQTIALLWTLLKQNPEHPNEGGVIKKALIVCPVTLISNWKAEFNKWLGNERIGVFVADGQKHIRLTDFTHGKSYSVMIIGYEKLRTVQDELKKGAGIDIVVADEGHRLKTAQNKSAQAIRNLNTERRVILSGTPIQNDLSEFFTMVDFVNPGLLNSYNTFKKAFEGPILKSRQPDARPDDLEKGTAREEELASLTSQFILRRNATILAKYLKPKTEYVLFCKPTQAQEQVYQSVLASPIFGRVLGSSEASLQLITMLKKVCNAPSLLVKKSDADTPSNSNVAQLLEEIPADILKKNPVVASSKFRVLDRMLKQLSKTTSEKIVLVSNYTSTLDLLMQHLSSLNLPFLRLDGSTPQAKRQDLVNTFNKTPASKYFAFLLSAKSGGAGINLIGASRLVLFDVDWNPATDLQAMARIHRDGQKLPVKIYRFLMSGGMDEKIYQRQITKLGLADSVMDGKKNEASFSAQELRDLFRLDVHAQCQTHDLLGCDCGGLGGHEAAVPAIPTEAIEVADSDSSDNEDEDGLPIDPICSLVPATKSNVEAQQKIALDMTHGKRSKKSKKMQALMEYKHIDTSIFAKDPDSLADNSLEEVKNVLGDEVLVKVLEDERCKVGFLFTKKG